MLEMGASVGLVGCVGLGRHGRDHVVPVILIGVY